MPDEGEPPADRSEPVQPEAAEPSAGPPPDPVTLSKVDKDILSLRKAGHGYEEIGKRVKLSKTSVHDHVQRLIMEGFLNPPKPGEDEAEKAAAPVRGAARTPVLKNAVGRATMEASNTAANMAAETIDVFTKTGEWAWQKFNDRARDLGYTSIFEWLGDCVEYWEVERAGWKTVLDELHLARQRVEQLEIHNGELLDKRSFRQELWELVLFANMMGRPYTDRQITALLLAKDPDAQPASAFPALPPG